MPDDKDHTRHMQDWTSQARRWDLTSNLTRSSFHSGSQNRQSRQKRSLQRSHRTRQRLVLLADKSNDKQTRTRNSILFCGDSCLHSTRQEGSSQTTPRSSSKRVKTSNGRMTPILLIVQKPTGSQKEMFDE